MHIIIILRPYYVNMKEVMQKVIHVLFVAWPVQSMVLLWYNNRIQIYSTVDDSNFVGTKK